MSIASEITRINNNIANAYTQVNSKGGTLPATQNSNNLASAISSIPQPGGGDIDWSVIGFDGMPQGIQDGYDYAIEIMENWNTSSGLVAKFYNDYKLVFMPSVNTSGKKSTLQMFYGAYSLISVALFDMSSVTKASEMFRDCHSLKSIPKFNTSNVTTMNRMFANCYSLTTVPFLDTSSTAGAGGITSMFENVNNLTNESLDNILQMCITATLFTGTKNLVSLGIRNSVSYPTSRIQALPHYQDFLDAGWTIGY